MIEPDVIVDILSRVKDKAGVPEQTAQSIEAEARRYWGGERCYIAKAGESPRRREAHSRAEQVRAARLRGDHIPLIARRFEISERHVRRILGIVESMATPAANDAPETPAGGRPRRRRRKQRKTDTSLP